jgi:hypothetical protein
MQIFSSERILILLRIRELRSYILYLDVYTAFLQLSKESNVTAKPDYFQLFISP